MARPLRIEYEGALYHVTSRGNEKKEIYCDIADRRRMMHLLDVSHRRYGVVIYAFAFMSNHYHHLPETPRGNLSRMMHYVNCAYTVYFNRKYDRAGHLFQGRYKAILVQKENYLLELVRYIVLNPVRAGLVEEPEDYPWSSMKYYLGFAPPPPWLDVDYVLSRFGNRRKEAIRAFKKFVMQGIGEENPLKKAYAKCILGSEEFIEEVKTGFINRDVLCRDISHSKKIGTKVELREIKSVIVRIFGKEEKLAFPGKIKRGNIAHKLFIYLARKHTDHSLKDIALFLGWMTPSAVQMCLKRFKDELRNREDLNNKVRAVEKKLGLMLYVET